MIENENNQLSTGQLKQELNHNQCTCVQLINKTWVKLSVVSYSSAIEKKIGDQYTHTNKQYIFSHLLPILLFGRHNSSRLDSVKILYIALRLPIVLFFGYVSGMVA